MQSESQKWDEKCGARLKGLLAGEFETIPDAFLVLSGLVLATPQKPLAWVKKAKSAIRSQHQRCYKLEAIAKLLPNGESAAGADLLRLVGNIETDQRDGAGQQLHRWLRGGDGRAMSDQWQDRLAWLLGIEREVFLEKISASAEATEAIIKPASKPTPAKAETWTADLLATELMFPKIGQSPVNAKRFYEGWPATASELAADCDFRRTFQSKDSPLVYADILTKKIVPALKDAAAQRRIPVFLFTGPGGAGKTTVLERIGFDLTQRQDLKVGVLRIQKRERPIDAKDILYSDCNKAFKEGKFKVVALFLDEAAAQSDGIKSLIELAHRQHFKICLFLADQTNKRGLLPKDVDEFALGRLADEEIDELLSRLEKFDCLGVLQEKTREERLDLFRNEQRYDKQLLVVLREVTSGKRFDTIIFEEWERIPSDRGKGLYLFAAILHSVGAYLPEDAARRACRCLKETADWRQIRDSCREIVAGSRAVESGMGTALKSRHPIIAEALVHARFLEKHTSEDANDFAEDAAEIFYALDAMRNEQNKRSVFSLVRQLALSKTFALCLAAATDIKRLCEAMSYFDEVWEGQHNNFFIQVLHAWERHGATALAGAARF